MGFSRLVSAFSVETKNEREKRACGPSIQKKEFAQRVHHDLFFTKILRDNDERAVNSRKIVYEKKRSK